nr:MAG TPA: hypothetical protein [Bacteriophage sp.]
MSEDEASYLGRGSIFLRRKTNFRGEEKYRPRGRKFIAVRTAVNFYV